MDLKFLIETTTTIEEAITRLNLVKGVGLIVVESLKSMKLAGVVTDGDIRRALLKNHKASEMVTVAMNHTPLIFKQKKDKDVIEIAKRKIAKVVPTVDINGVVTDLYFVGNEADYAIPVVIMAGGLGERLGDLTKECPKPMLDVGGMPVLEKIIKNFTDQGYLQFYIAVNYKSEIIENYFEDGKKFGCRITYLKEEKRLGTAGALSLLPREMSGPFYVMNGDLLTQINFKLFQEFHVSSSKKCTVGVRQYDLQVPFGVVNIDEGGIRSFSEKPVHSFYVNAGIYILDSSYLRVIPTATYYDMPQFINELLKMSEPMGCYPVIEEWIDIGSRSDLETARKHLISRQNE